MPLDRGKQFLSDEKDPFYSKGLPNTEEDFVELDLSQKSVKASFRTTDLRPDYGAPFQPNQIDQVIFGTIISHDVDENTAEVLTSRFEKQTAKVLDASTLYEVGTEVAIVRRGDDWHVVGQKEGGLMEVAVYTSSDTVSPDYSASATLTLSTTQSLLKEGDPFVTKAGDVFTIEHGGYIEVLVEYDIEPREQPVGGSTQSDVDYVIGVALTVVSGSAGGSGATCSFVYSMELADGSIITPRTPLSPRIPNVTYTAADFGLYSRVFGLLYTNETPVPGTC